MRCVSLRAVGHTVRMRFLLSFVRESTRSESVAPSLQDLYSRRVNRRRCAREHGDSGIRTCTTTCPPYPCRPEHRQRTARRPALPSQRRLEDRRAPSISAGHAEAGEMKQKG
ncbi:hypothetical protein CERSUDRAFT_112275, partial [Gelatoporia subvermispora B]